MLQWMGGSRRKVNASRKSMHNKQKHYFEQRKRQQQTTGLANHIDVSSKRIHYHEETRSLDILSFLNIATVAQRGFLPEILLPDKCSVAAVPENAPATQNVSSKVEGLKMSASSNEFSSNSAHFKSEEKQEEIQDEVLVLDLLNDDNREIDCIGRSIPETHVAFSVGGLGKVGMETPAHSPRRKIRGFVSPPRARKHIQNSAKFRSMPYDLGTELSAAMNDINKLIDGDSAEVICKPKDTTCEKKNRRSMKFIDSDINSDVLGDLSDCFASGTENFQENQNELWESSNGMLDNDFPLIREYDAVWENKSSYSESRASVLSNPKISGIYEYGLGDFYLARSRSGAKAAKQQKRFGNSAKSDHLFSFLALEKDCNFVPPEKDRSFFDLPSWSLTQKEDLPDSISSLSEESCSSTAGHSAREDKSYDLLSHSANLKESKKSHLDEVDMNLINLKESKKNHMDDLDMGLGAGNYKCMSKQLNSKARCCSKVSSEVKRIADPDCIFPFKEEFSSEFTHGRSKSNIPIDHESFYDFDVEKNMSRELSGFAFQSQKPHTHIWMTEGCLPYPFSPGDNQNGTQMPDSLGQWNACKDNGVLDRTSIKVENKILSEKSLYSLSDRENSRETPSIHVELNKRTQRSSSSPKVSNPSEEAEISRKTKEVSGLQTYISDKVQLACSSPAPSEVGDKESVNEKLGSEVTIFGSIAGDISYQVMQERYVLLCVQKGKISSNKELRLL